MTAEFQHTK